jgi:multiple sugar transport system ATP-binding protein
MARVTLEQIRKAYGDYVALHPLDLEIDDGEFVSVLGPSGSGKSTLLKLIAGIEEASGGRVYFDGRDVTQTPPERRDIAMVFQSYALYPTMNVFDNIAFPLRVRKRSKAEIKRRVGEVAELLGIEGLLGRRPRELSGGERQRTAIGRAMVRNPKVFLFDEPLSNLDAHLRAGMRTELKHLHRVLGSTFVYVTHDQDDALDMGQRVAVLAAGRLQQFCSSQELYEQPANRFIASFVGHPPMNLLYGRLAHEGPALVFRSNAFVLSLGARDAAGRLGDRVVLGIRPEAVIVSSALEGRPAGVVESTSALGYRRIYATVRIGDFTVMARIPDGIVEPSLGDTVGLEFDDRELHLFDAHDGTALPDRIRNLEPVELEKHGAATSQ